MVRPILLLATLAGCSASTSNLQNPGSDGGSSSSPSDLATSDRRFDHGVTGTISLRLIDRDDGTVRCDRSITIGDRLDVRGSFRFKVTPDERAPRYETPDYSTAISYSTEGASNGIDSVTIGFGSIVAPEDNPIPTSTAWLPPGLPWRVNFSVFSDCVGRDGSPYEFSTSWETRYEGRESYKLESFDFAYSEFDTDPSAKPNGECPATLKPEERCTATVGTVRAEAHLVVIDHRGGADIYDSVDDWELQVDADLRVPGTWVVVERTDRY